MVGFTILLCLLSAYIGKKYNKNRLRRDSHYEKLKIFTIALLLFVSMSLLTGCTPARTTSKTLNVFTWEGMFPQEVLTGFEKETGISINYNNFDFDETMLAKLQAAKGGDYDLVIADDYIIEVVIEEGLAQKLDKSKLENYSNINPIYQGQFYDPTDEYTIPYGAGVQTIVFDPSRVDIDIQGYADLFHPSLKDNVGVIANHRVINGLALKILGESYNTEDIATIEKQGKSFVNWHPIFVLSKMTIYRMIYFQVR